MARWHLDPKRDASVLSVQRQQTLAASGVIRQTVG